MNELYNDLKILGNLIHIVANRKTKPTSSEHSLEGGNKTRKNTKKSANSSIFKRKKFVKRFKKPFFLSLK
jgi:hypothetical protein